MAKPRENTKEKLLSGCEIFFPDTVFYEKGAPKFIAMNDKDYCLSKFNEHEEKKPMLPNPQDLFPKLHKIILDRKKNSKQYWLQLSKMNR